MLELGAQQSRTLGQPWGTDRTKVPAEVIQLAAHEVDPSLTRLSRTLVPVTLKVVKVRVTPEQNDPPSSLASDAGQYELKLRMQWARTFMTKKISLGRSTETSETGVGSWEMAPGELSFSLQLFSTKMCGRTWPSVGWVLLGSPCNTSYPPRITILPSPSG